MRHAGVESKAQRAQPLYDGAAAGVEKTSSFPQADGHRALRRRGLASAGRVEIGHRRQIGSFRERQSGDPGHIHWRGGRLTVAMRVAQEEAMNTTKQQRASQLAVELEEIGWRTALKLAEIDRREYDKQPQRSLN